MRGGDRTKAKMVYFTPDEWATVEAAAVQAGRPSGRFVREAALTVAGKPPRQRRGSMADAMVRELARLGNNINQLAREANAGRFPDGARLEAALSEVLAAVKRLD